MNKFVFVVAFVVLHQSSFSQSISIPVYKRSEGEAKAIVQRVLKASPVIDGHNDMLRYFYECKECPRDLDQYRLDTITKGHTDIVRWRKGGVGAQLLNVFGNEYTARNLLDAYDLVYRMSEKYSKDLSFATSASDIRKAMKQNKIAIVPSMEFSVRLENSMAMIRIFHKLGLRAVTLAYQTNDIADGSDDTARHGGLSALGKEMVEEMNRTGIMVDISHVSTKTMQDVLELSKAPVIFSHSNVRALTEVNRNVPDDVLLQLKQNGGIIMLTFVPYFTTNEFSRWMAKGDSVYYAAEKMFSGNREQMDKEMDRWEAANPMPVVTVANLADHFDYVKKLIGVDHIGMAGDYDGIYYTIKGLENVSTYPHLLIELARRGWSESELRKITGENFLRVFEQVEATAAQLKKKTEPSLYVTSDLSGQDTLNAKVDVFIQQQIKERNIPGLSVAVMKNDKLVFSKAYGYSNLEHKVPVKENTVFSIMSTTKSFTGIATMMLVEEGKLSLDDDIGRYFSDLPQSWKPITIRQLLTHTSGISSPTDYKKIPCNVGKDVRNYERGDLIKEVACLPLLFSPGDSSSYGDTGPYLLGMLIEKISRTSYENFVKQRIFDPLQMHHSGFVSYTDLIPNRAEGYVFRDGKHYLAPRFELDEFANAGVRSTALDIVQLHHAFRSEKLLKKNTWKLMWTNARLNNGKPTNFGLGFGLTPFQGKKRVGHYGGGGLGFASGLTHFPEENLTVVLLTNVDQEDIGLFVNTIASFYFK